MRKANSEPLWAKQLEELLGDRLSMELDFNNPEHESFFMAYHGGEEWMRKNSPHTYQAYRRTKECIRKGGEAYVLDYSALPPEIVPLDQHSVEARENKNDFCKVKVRITTNVLDQVEGIVMSGFIKDDASGRCHATFYDDFTEKEIKQNHCHLALDCYRTLYVNDTEGFITRGVIDYFSDSMYVKSVVVQSRPSQGTKIADIVESIEIIHPRSTKNPPNNPYRIIYKERKDDKADRIYTDVTPKNNRVETWLPLEGIITLKEDFQAKEFPGRGTDDIQLIYEKVGHAYFDYSMQEMKPFFSKDSNQKIHFTFPEKWVGDMDAKTYTSGVMAFLSCPFYYTVTNTKESGSAKDKDVSFLIHSENKLAPGETYYESKESSEVIIPPIKYLWGCLGKDTMIRMADFSEKKICDIRMGDMVWVYEHESLPVMQVITGRELVMIYLEAENGDGLLLTENHPILTKRGVVRADKLNAADILILPDGEESALKFVYEEEYDDQIYCLELEDSHMICGGGLLVGDFNCQNDGYRRSDESVKSSMEAEEFLKEMRLLMENMHEE